MDAIWLSPFYTSPQKDAGYDVADYCNIDPVFGTLADAEQLITTAHDLGLRVIVDLVPNHSSDQHVWFHPALRAAPGSPERERYMFREGQGEAGGVPRIIGSPSLEDQRGQESPKLMVLPASGISTSLKLPGRI